MWVKTLANGERISEDSRNGLTWLKTPLNGLFAVQLICQTHCSKVLQGYSEYWHSRTAICINNGPRRDIAERIQGRREDGRWDTITWNGREFVDSIEDRAIGKPIVK